MKILNQRYTTLLEVLIAMVLTVLVLTALTFFYQQVTTIGIEIDKVKIYDFYTRYVENRLADTLPKMLPKSNREFVFFSVPDENFINSGNPSLIFSYDNGVSINPLFSNEVIARLYVDNTGKLTLASWPTPSRWDKQELPPIHKEILLSGVDKMEFAFFIPPEPVSKNVEAPQQESKQKDDNKKSVVEVTQEENSQPETKGDWLTQPWLKEYKSLPAIIKITIKMAGKEQPMTFAFPLVNFKEHIIYD